MPDTAPGPVEPNPTAPAAPPTAPPRRPPAVLAAAEAAAVSGLPTQIALAALLAAVGITPFAAGGGLSMTYVSLLMPADTILIAAIVAWRLRAGGERVADLLVGGRRWPRECAIGLALVPAVFGGVTAMMLILRAAWPSLHNVSANPFAALIRTPRDAALMVVLVIVTGGFKEELQRAFVLHRFGQSLGGARLGLVAYSAVFGAGHIIQGYDVAIVTTLLGLAWGAVYLSRRNVLAPSVSHAGFNAAQVLQFAVFGA